MAGKKRRPADQALRPPMRSPGRPPGWRREHQKRFWEGIAGGYRARKRAWRQDCLLLSERAGSGRVAGCRRSRLSHCRSAICPSSNA